jgi:Ca2+-binding RTX toxin-like protein
LDANEVIQLTANDDKSASTDTGITATVELDVANAAGVTIVDGAASDASEDTVTTLNVVANKATTAFALNTIADSNLALNISGAKAVTLNHTAAASEKVTVDASAMTGALTATASANMLSITAGSGDDNITAVTAAKFALVGGAGTDTLVTKADMTKGTFSGFEKLTVTDNDNFLASQLNGQTVVVGDILTGGGGAVNGNVNVTGAKSVDITTMDFSGINFTDATNEGIDMTSAAQDTTKMTADSAVTITGSGGKDILIGFGGADTISGGAGADTLTGGAGNDVLTGGEGGDTYNTGTGSDTVVLTETTAATDTVNIGGTTTDVTTIQGFVAGADSNDVIGFTLATVEAMTAVTNLVRGTGSDVTAGYTNLVKKVDTSGVDIGAAENTIITIDGNHSSAAAVADAL